jgi:predicted Zn-dependent peptidase
LEGTHYILRLPNGLTIVAEPLPAVRSAAFQFIVPAGAITDPEDRQGAATIVEGLCYRGAAGRTARQLSDSLDALGMQRGGGAELEYSTFGGALLADDLLRALEIYADLLLRPHLPADQLGAERDLALQKLERLEDNPADKLFVHLRRAYYPGAYGRSALGRADDLRALTAEEVAAEHAARYRPEGAILAVAGRFDWHELSGAIHRLFGEWSGPSRPQPLPDCTGRLAYRHLSQETNQEQIGVMYPAVPLDHPDYYLQRMAVATLSGGMSARLFTEVREKRGLCYAVRAMNSTVKGGGAILAYAGTTPERCQETLDVLLHELVRLKEGISDEELARARTGVLSSLVMQTEAARARALSIARDYYLLDRVRTMQEIRSGVEGATAEAIQEHLHRHPARDFTIVTLGPVELSTGSNHRAESGTATEAGKAAA